MKQRVLITGGAGFIGSHTADLLLDHGYKVRILDNLSSKTHSNHWPDYLSPKIEKMKGDVRYKKHWLEALNGADYVIHLAAWMDMMPDFSRFFAVNAVGTANLYETIVSHNLPIKKVLVASSQFVYGQGKWQCSKDGVVFPEDRDDKCLRRGKWDPVCPMCEGKIDPLTNNESHHNPPNQYAISKLAQELIAIRLGKLYKIPSVAMRYSIVHGSRQSLRNTYSGALRIFTLQTMNGQPPSILEDGGQLRDYVSVHDVARANLLVLESAKAEYQVYNVGGGKGYTVIQLAKIIADVLGKKPFLKPTGLYRVGDTRHSISDISKLRKLGWKPLQSEKENVREFISWVNRYGNVKNRASLAFADMLHKGVLKRVE